MCFTGKKVKAEELAEGFPVITEHIYIILKLLVSGSVKYEDVAILDAGTFHADSSAAEGVQLFTMGGKTQGFYIGFYIICILPILPGSTRYGLT